MYGEGLDGPSMGGYSRAPSFSPDYGLRSHESSYPRHGTHQRVSSVYSPSISPSALPAMEEASQSRSASPHISQFNNFHPHSQTEVYNGSYAASEVESSSSTAPNMSGFNLPTFPSIHNFSTGSTSTSHRTNTSLESSAASSLRSGRSSLISQSQRQLQEELEAVKRENFALTIQVKTLNSTIDRITSNTRLAPPASQTFGMPYSRSISPAPTDILEESYDDHPRVSFWHKSDWAAFQEKEKLKPTDPAKGDAQKDSTARYIEDKNGEPVSAATLREIRKTARRVWAMFKERGEAPAQWSKASSKVVNAYRLEMRRQHPELRLCANDWKSEALATQAYPSWYQNHCKSSIKAEEEAPTAATRPSHKKRRRHGEVDESKECSQEKGAKKPKTLDDKPNGADNADDGGGFSMGGDFVKGGNDTNSAIDSFTRKEGKEPGPSDELKRNPAVSSEPAGSLFWMRNSLKDISPTIQVKPPEIAIVQPTPLKPTGGRDDGQYAMDVDGALLGPALGLPLLQGQSDAVSTTSTQPVRTTIAPASPSSGHDNAASQSTSDHAAPPPPPPLPHITPLPNGTVLDAGPAAETLKPPLAPKPKLKAKTGTVLKDTGHQTARNFCGLDWMRSNPGGLKSEFDAYFKSLSAEQLKVWKDMEAQAKSAAKTKSSNTKAASEAGQHDDAANAMDGDSA